MSLLHEFIEESDYLHCKISGTYDNLWDAIEVFGKVILRSRCSGLTNILYDTRDMTNYPGATEKIIYMSGVIDQHDSYVKFGGKPLRVAYLGSEQVDRAYAPGMDLAASRAFATTSTSDPEAALAWFLDPAPKSASNWQKDEKQSGQ